MMRRFLPPACVSTLAAACSLGSLGCSCIGLAVGGSMPCYATASSLDDVSPGTDVRITHDRKETTGTFASSDPDVVHLEGEPSIERMSITKVEKSVGSYWLEGLVMGAALDAVTVAVFVFIISKAPSGPIGGVGY
jgi:hypothetical protein